MNAVSWLGNTSSVLVCMVPSILPRIKKCGDAVALKITKNLTNDEGFYSKMSAEYLFWPNGMRERKDVKHLGYANASTVLWFCAFTYILELLIPILMSRGKEAKSVVHPVSNGRANHTCFFCTQETDPRKPGDAHAVQRDNGSFMSTNG